MEADAKKDEAIRAVAGDREDVLQVQLATACALASLALTRSQRASKLVAEGKPEDAEALREEVQALEELLQKITKALA